ncbi:MAG: hypothetical protein HYU66_06865 [Armatimonadetes bacterium]|nr:hypothetical protein [Armatimonadota bacterium]
MSTLTMRERMLRTMRGQPVDRVPFVQYDGIAAPNSECWEVVGRDNLGVLRWCGVHGTRAPNCWFEHQDFERGSRRRRTVLHTPAGAIAEERAFEEFYGSSSVYEHFVKEPRDYEVLLAYLRDTEVFAEPSGLLAAIRDLGDDGLPHAAVVRTPWQQLWVQWVSLADLSVHTVECPGILAEVMAELERIELDIFEVVREVAAEVPLSHVDIPDNITAPAIGEARFREHCLPLYQRLAAMLEPFDVPVFVHLDGDLKPLWGAIGETGMRGIDSLSPPPDNDTSVADAVRLWPDMAIWINYPSSVHLQPAEVVYEQTRRMIAEAGPTGRLQIQVSENVPQFAWRTSYPAIVAAIRDAAG